MSGLVLQLALLQVGLPLALIVLNAFVPTASRWGLFLRTAAIALLIAYAALAGIWLFPPWWTPWLLELLLVGSTIWRIRRIGSPRRAWSRFTEIALAGLASVGCLVLLWPPIAGRATPYDAIDIAMPLGAGSYLVISGGTSETINAHIPFLSLERAQHMRGQGYAVDIIGIDQWGLHAKGIAPADPRRYVIYGKPVLSPCDGTVAWITDGVQDMVVPEVDRDHMTGNSVLLDCGSFAVLLAHLAPQSISVSVGTQLQAGDQLGAVGNTGNTSEPHLHVHVQQDIPAGDPLAGDPHWMTIGGRFLVRNEAFTVQ